MRAPGAARTIPGADTRDRGAAPGLAPACAPGRPAPAAPTYPEVPLEQRARHGRRWVGSGGRGTAEDGGRREDRGRKAGSRGKLRLSGPRSAATSEWHCRSRTPPRVLNHARLRPPRAPPARPPAPRTCTGPPALAPGRSLSSSSAGGGGQSPACGTSERPTEPVLLPAAVQLRALAAKPSRPRNSRPTRDQ